MGLGRVLGRFGEGLGRVWEGFWEGFGGSGSFWDAPKPFQHCFWTLLGFVGFPGLSYSFPAFSRLSWALLVFAGLCWALTRVIIAGGERSERAKRASEALWCFLWVSLGFRWRTLAFSGFLLLRFFACCLAFSLNGILAFPHSFSILFLAAPCLLLFSLVLPCANIS